MFPFRMYVLGTTVLTRFVVAFRHDISSVRYELVFSEHYCGNLAGDENTIYKIERTRIRVI